MQAALGKHYIYFSMVLAKQMLHSRNRTIVSQCSCRHSHPASGRMTTLFIWKAFSKHLLCARDCGCGGRSQSLLLECLGEKKTQSNDGTKDTVAVRTAMGTWIKSYGHRRGTD